jgi:uroporphyrinogen-III synthase
MSRPVVILRPEPGNAETVLRAKAAGLSAFGLPLFKIESLAWTPPPTDDYEAVLITSANAVRHAGDHLSAYLGLPVYAVGYASAEAARGAGLTVAREGDGSVDDILKTLPAQKLLHLAGDDTTPLSLHAHQIDRVVTYRSRALTPEPQFWGLLERAPVVLVHSVRAATYFAELAKQSPTDQISVVAISGKVAAAAGNGWEAVATAAHPRDEAMIDATIALMNG